MCVWRIVAAFDATFIIVFISISNIFQPLHVRLYNDIFNIAELLLHDGLLVGLFSNLIWMRLYAMI